MKITFGKFAGSDLADLPFDYLEWLSTINLREPLKSAVEAERERRAMTQDGSGAYDRDVAAKIVKTGYRVLCKEMHPDAGGGHEAMLALNAARAYLEGRLLA